VRREEGSARDREQGDGAAAGHRCLRHKLEDYREAGVQPVWILYPGTKVIDVWKPDGTAVRLGPKIRSPAATSCPGSPWK
jgi:hypothetical protein